MDEQTQPTDDAPEKQPATESGDGATSEPSEAPEDATDSSGE